jgi:hypothetical protein
LRLLYKPEPYADESLRGYLIRLAEKNGYKLIWLYKLAKLFKPSGYILNLHLIKEPSYNFDLLAQVTEMQVHRLTEMTLFNDFVLENNINSKEINTVYQLGVYGTQIQVCPVCIQENGYFRKVWDITLYTCCHIHKCLMVNICSQCQRNLSPFRLNIRECRCGKEIKQQKVITVEGETRCAEFIAQLFNPNVNKHFLPNNPLTKLKTEQIVHVLTYFAPNIMHYYFSRRVSFSSGIPMTVLHQTVYKSFMIFDNWPQSFYDFMDEFRKIPKEITKNYQMGMNPEVTNTGSISFPVTSPTILQVRSKNFFTVAGSFSF